MKSIEPPPPPPDDAGVAVITVFAVPDKEIVVGLSLPLCVIDTVAFFKPALVGAKVTLIAQLAPTATFVHWFVCEN